MKQLAIFDLDGTLINTIEDLAASVNHALAQKGFRTHDCRTIQSFVGNGVTRLMERALPQGHKDSATVQDALVLFRAHYDVHCTDRSRPYPGIPEVLETLQDKGIILAVASNKYQKATEKVISTLLPQIHFAEVTGISDTIPRKPDPAIIEHILTQCGITDKSTVLHTGDALTDMQVALNAGIDCCAVSWGFRPLEELLPFHPCAVARTPKDILNCFFEND